MRKHVIRVLIASLLIGSCLNVTAYAEGATVTGSQVNVRSGPGVSYDVLGSVSRGTILEVTDRSNSDWYAISYGGRVGYISASYVTLEDVSYPAAVVPDGSASSSSSGSSHSSLTAQISPTTTPGTSSATSLSLLWRRSTARSSRHPCVPSRLCVRRTPSSRN